MAPFARLERHRRSGSSSATCAACRAVPPAARGADVRQRGCRRSAVLRARRVRGLSRGQRARRRGRARPVECRTAPARRAAAENHRSEQLRQRRRPAVAAVAGAVRRRRPSLVKTLDGREIRGVRRNEDTFSLQMIDTSGQLRMLDKLKLASVEVQTTSLHPPDLRDAIVGCRHHEPRRLPSHAERPRHEQDRRRAAASGRRHLRATAQFHSRTAQLADVLGRLPGHALFRAEEHRHDERGPASRRMGRAGARRQRQREHTARRRRRDVRRPAAATPAP